MVCVMYRIKEEKIRFLTNLELQLDLKQGQVELDPYGFVPDFRDAILLERKVVEDLNAKIKACDSMCMHVSVHSMKVYACLYMRGVNVQGLGSAKLQSMEDSKDFKRGIVQLEWERLRLQMQMDDLEQKKRDIQLFKVSRQIRA